MTRFIKRFAGIALGGMFALSAVSFADFLACSYGNGVGITDTRKVQPRRRGLPE
ncbi:MAG TPA: hypothetical protein VM659_12895 [Dongiaceae bacterium]|nr:hypothetical protein [Dongiaceae bacterium]